MAFDEEFIEFVKELFPSINPYTKEQVKNSIEQFNERGTTFSCYNDCDLAGICQGDIFRGVPFIKIAEDGSITKSVREGIVLSNSCDIEHDDYILVSPFYSFEEGDLSENQIAQVKKNLAYGYIYFPDESGETNFADFSQIESLPKSCIENGLSSGKMNKKHSLNLVGYYLLVCKLTIHFLRPEDTVLQGERKHLEYSIPTTM
jgi:hypothetical protein